MADATAAALKPSKKAASPAPKAAPAPPATSSSSSSASPPPATSASASPPAIAPLTPLTPSDYAAFESTMQRIKTTCNQQQHLRPLALPARAAVGDAGKWKAWLKAVARGAASITAPHPAMAKLMANLLKLKSNASIALSHGAAHVYYIPGQRLLDDPAFLKGVHDLVLGNSAHCVADLHFVGVSNAWIHEYLSPNGHLAASDVLAIVLADDVKFNKTATEGFVLGFAMLAVRKEREWVDMFEREPASREPIPFSLSLRREEAPLPGETDEAAEARVGSEMEAYMKDIYTTLQGDGLLAPPSGVSRAADMPYNKVLLEVDFVCSAAGVGAAILKHLLTAEFNENLKKELNQIQAGGQRKAKAPSVVVLKAVESVYAYYPKAFGFYRSVDSRRIYPLFVVNKNGRSAAQLQRIQDAADNYVETADRLVIYTVKSGADAALLKQLPRLELAATTATAADRYLFDSAFAKPVQR